VEPTNAIDVLVGFSRLVSEGDVPPEEIIERLADVVIERAQVGAILLVEVGPDGRPELLTQRNLVIEAPLSVDEIGEELERLALAGCQRGCHHAYTLPLVSGGGLFGAAVLLWDGDPPDGVGLHIVEGLVDLAAVALDRSYRSRALVETLDALRKSREALARKEKLEALGQMAAVVAHEVKNPLASLSGALQVLGSRMASDSADGRIVDMLLERVKDLSAMVDDLLIFARPRQPAPQRIGLRTLLDSAADTLRANVEYEDLAIEIDVEPGDGRLLADPAMIRGVLLNLLLNAAQAMDGAGRVCLSATIDGSVCRVCVSDSGPGVPADKRDRIFEPFVTTKTRGSGLGLAVAAQTIDAHGGTIRLESPESGGAVFIIELPA
jgi:signal transduction histidine kinase